MTKLLWVLQGLLAALFLFAGGVKLVMPIEALEAQSTISGEFLKFVAVCEILGAIGLILPSLLRIRPGLTPLAAAGLIVIMIGATTVTIRDMGIAPALFPFVVGILLAFVAYGRLSLRTVTARETRA